MNKGMTKAVALAMVAAMTLSACNSGSANNGSTTTTTPDANNGSTTSTPVAENKNEIKDLVIYKTATSELSTFNLLYSQDNAIFEQLTNLVDGLAETNPKGEVIPCLAESWETTDGGETWTYHIREGIKWVDVNGNVKADCNAHDWATGLEWVLNFHKNESANTSMPMEMIKGATDYINYTRELSEEEAFALTADNEKFRELVGIEIVDDYTIKYTCPAQKPYFHTLGLYACLYPMSQAMVDELGGPKEVKAMDNTNMWYNGGYTMTSFINGNEKVYTKNPHYWDTDSKRFDTITMKMVDSADTAFQLYTNGEIDYVALTESNLNTIYNDPNHKFHDYLTETIKGKHSYQWHWNYDKRFEDGTPDTNWNTAIANKNFRLSFNYLLNLTEYFKRTNAITPLKIENNAYTMEGLITLSDGTEYTQLVKDKLGIGKYNGETPVRWDQAKGEEYKAKAIEELTALGVTFPVGIDYYISGSSQTALDSATVLANAISQYMGDDYVKLNIKTYVSSMSKEVRDPKLMSLQSNGWGADYGDPMNFLGQEIKGYDNAWYADAYSNINEVERNAVTEELHAAYDKFTEMVWAADAIVDDMDARYKAFAEAEAYMLSEGLVMPFNYSMSWCLTKINIHDYQNAMYGVCNGKFKNVDTNSEGYTTAEMEAIVAAK